MEAALKKNLLMNPMDLPFILYWKEREKRTTVFKESTPIGFIADLMLLLPARCEHPG